MMYHVTEVKSHATTRVESFDFQDSITLCINVPISKCHVRSEASNKDRDNAKYCWYGPWYISPTVTDECDTTVKR
jgi:hypothetical protein